jgi:putative ABC transport system permease protein
MHMIFENCRQSVRTLRKSPGLLIVVVLTLAFGIGANTTVFSIAQAVLLRSMNFPDSEHLMFLSRGYPGYPQGGGNFSYPAYRDILQQNSSFDDVAAFQSFGAVALTDGTEPVRVNANYITPSYLTLLGAQTSFGRLFRREEDRWDDADPVIVLSYGFWQREFAAANVVGQVIHLNQRAFTVIGITAASFRDAPGEIDSGEPVDAWIPLGLSNRLTGLASMSDRNRAILWGVAHLKPGITVHTAATDYASIGQRLAKEHPSTDGGFTFVAIPLKDRLVGQFYKPLWLLIGASIFILLICCANVANLLLARLVQRQRELAVRSALGASAKHLLGELLTENLAMLTLAAIVATLLTTWALKALSTWGQLNLPSVIHFHVDRAMLADCGIVSVLTILLFGVGPALAGARVDLRDAISRSGRQGMSLAHRRTARLLIISEVSLALILLAGTGLLLKSFRRMTTINLGFNTEKLLTLRLDLNSNKYDREETRSQFTNSLREKLNGLPGVTSTTIWGPGIPGRETWVVNAVAEGRDPNDPRNVIMSSRHSVNPGALSEMGIPLLRGRNFTAQDDAHAPLVAIVSEGTAKALWPGEDPLGKRFLPLGRTGAVNVIGVTADVVLRQRLEMSDAAIGISPGGLGPQLDVYMPYPQRPNRAVVVNVRVKADPASVTKAIRSSILSLDSTLPIYDVALLEDRLAAQDDASRALTTVTACYAILAMFLAALGLFGVLAHSVSRRTQELGIRMALGALPRDLLLMVLSEGARLTVVGIVAGLLGAMLLTRAMTSLLFGVSTMDPAVYLSISLVLLGVVMIACYLPARRAMGLDPIVALRHE